MEIEDRLAIGRDPGRIGFAMVKLEGAAVAFAALDGESPRDKPEEVGRKRLRLAESNRRPLRCHVAPDFRRIRDGGPGGRDFKGERQRALDVGLIEARKRLRCARGYEQRVQVLIVAVQRSIAGDECDVDDVLAAAHEIAGNHQVAVFGSDGHRTAVRLNRRHALGRLREIEDDRRPLGQPEANAQRAADLFVFARRDAQGQRVPHGADVRRPFGRERSGNPLSRRRHG